MARDPACSVPLEPCGLQTYRKSKLNPYAKKLLLSHSDFPPSPPPSTLRLHPSQQQEGLELQFCLGAKAHQHNLLQFGSIYDALTSAYSELNRKAAGKVGSVLPTPAEIFRALVRADKKQPILWVFKALLLKPSSERKQLYNPLATERQEPFLSSPCTHLAPILPC